jgi:hypothetical protein
MLNQHESLKWIFETTLFQHRVRRKIKSLNSFHGCFALYWRWKTGQTSTTFLTSQRHLSPNEKIKVILIQIISRATPLPLKKIKAI